MNIKKLFSHPRAKIALGVGAVMLLAIALVIVFSFFPPKKDEPTKPEAPVVAYETDVLLDTQYNEFMPIISLPKQSNLQMVVQVKMDGQVVGESGKINPGEQVPYIPYDGKDNPGPGKQFQGELILLFLNPESGAQITDTTIPVTITTR
jgi:hypothetical protein